MSHVLVDYWRRKDTGDGLTAKERLYKRIRKAKDFWIWDPQEHLKKLEATNGDCCFNHIVGLPEKNDHKMPLFDYQKEIMDAIESFKPNEARCLWIKKATGLGISELFLRWMPYKAITDPIMSNAQMAIVTGPRIDLAVSIMDRMKQLFFPHGVTFDSEKTKCELGDGCLIECFPSHHLAAMRGLPKLKIIFLDEADFFPKHQQVEARHVSERYIAKSNPWILMVSTPNLPEELFETIEKEEPSLYKKIFLPYTVGVGKIYTKQEIKNAMKSRSFQREYNLAYLGTEGNVFSPELIDYAIELGKQYDPSMIIPYAKKCIGVDPGFGSSKFALCLGQLHNNQIQVLYADEFHRQEMPTMVRQTIQLMARYGECKAHVDGSSPPVIKALKRELPERIDYEQHLKDLKDRGMKDDDLIRHMRILPVGFGSEGREMLAHCNYLVGGKFVAIHPKFTKLITSMRTAVATEYKLDKELTAYDDLFDAFRLMLFYFRVPRPSIPYYSPKNPLWGDPSNPW
jgi:hypothetical protein